MSQKITSRLSALSSVPLTSLKAHTPISRLAQQALLRCSNELLICAGGATAKLWALACATSEDVRHDLHCCVLHCAFIVQAI